MLETDLGPVAYDERGSGQPLVLLPSGAHDRHDFDELRALLPERFRTIAVDWPGHGASPPLRSPASAMAFADVAERVVDALAPEGAVVLGNSVGGFAAARLAIRRPELVKGLVLVDAGGFGGRPLYVRAFCALMAKPGFLRRIYPAFSARYMRARTAADRRVRDVGVATTRADPGLRTVAELWAASPRPSTTSAPRRPSISAPTLVVWGKRDPVIPLRLGRRAVAAIPGAELLVLDTGHAPHVSDPEAVAERLIPFAESAFAVGRGQHAPAQGDVDPHRWRSDCLASARLELGAGPVEAFRRGQGPALVFAHGWLANANLWRNVVDRLAVASSASRSTCRSARTGCRCQAPICRRPAAFGLLAKHELDPRASDSYALPACEDEAIVADVARAMANARSEPVREAGNALIGDWRRPVLFAWPPEDRVFPIAHARRYADALAAFASS